MNVSVPKIGARVLKTGLVVFLCCLIGPMFGRDNVLIACISGLMCMKNKLEESINAGIYRLIGTVIGGIVALLFVCIVEKVGTNQVLMATLTAVGVMFVIYMCGLFKLSSSVLTSCVAFLCVFINLNQVNSIQYATDRLIDTVIGVVLGILINKYVFKESFKKVGKIKK